MKKIFEKVKKAVQKVKDFFKGVIDKIFNIIDDHKETIEAVGFTVLYCAVATIGTIGKVYNKGNNDGYKLGYNIGVVDGCDGCMHFILKCAENSIKDISDNNIGG